MNSDELSHSDKHDLFVSLGIIIGGLIGMLLPHELGVFIGAGIGWFVAFVKFEYESSL
jgi:hypothetical protein